MINVGNVVKTVKPFNSLLEFKNYLLFSYVIKFEDYPKQMAMDKQFLQPIKQGMKVLCMLFNKKTA